MTDDLASTKGRKSGSRLRRLRHGWLALPSTLFVSVALLVAACGGPSSGPGVASVSSSTTGSTQASGPPSGGAESNDTSGSGSLLAYSACMRSHGVPSFPDPDSSGVVPKAQVVQARQSNPTQFDAASTACASLLANGGLGGTQATITAQDQQYYLQAAACMRTHGFPNFPDPTFSDGHVGFTISSSIDTNSAQFTQARQTCTKLIPAGLPQSGQSSESTTGSNGS